MQTPVSTAQLNHESYYLSCNLVTYEASDIGCQLARELLAKTGSVIGTARRL